MRVRYKRQQHLNHIPADLSLITALPHSLAISLGSPSSAMVSKILFFSMLWSLALARPHQRSMTVHESRHSAPAGFERTGVKSADAQVTLRIALAQNNIDGLIDSVYAVSTPSSPRYGQHLTKEEVRLLRVFSFT